MVQSKKRKQKHSLADVSPGAASYDEFARPIDWWEETDKSGEVDDGPRPQGGREGPDPGAGDGGRPGAVGQDAAGAGPSEDALWYTVCLETRGKRHIKDIKIKAGHRITFGPMATGGRFPACWRVYEGKELIFALTGVVWFHRRDFEVRDYDEV